METQNQQTTQPQYQQTVVIVGKQKSVGVAFLLAFLFGPLGLLYASVVGGIVMIIVSVLVAIVTLGLGLLITWPICIVWAIIAANSANKKMASGAGVNINTNFGNPPTQQPPPTQTINPQPQVQQQYSQPQAQEKPKADICEMASKSIKAFGDWTTNNKKGLFITGSALVLLIAALIIIPMFVQGSAWSNACKKNTEAAYDEYINKYPEGKYVAEAIAAKESAMFEDAKKRDAEEAFVSYLAKYPEGRFKNDALILMEPKMWARVKSIDKLYFYNDYIKRYPYGKYSAQAYSRIDALSRVASIPAAGSDVNVISSNSGTSSNTLSQHTPIIHENTYDIPQSGLRIYLHPGWKDFPILGAITIINPKGDALEDGPGVINHFGYQQEGWYTIFPNPRESERKVQILDTW